MRALLFADDAALATHSETAMQRFINNFARACEKFGLTISLKKTNVSAQDVSQAPEIKIGDHTLDVVDEFTYLGSITTMNLSLDSEISRRIGQASGTMSKLTKRTWENKYLSENTKMHIYQACVLSTLLYGSETWTTYMRQESRLNSFHLRCLRRILGVKWQDHITNSSEILSRAGTPSLHSLLSQRRLRWFGHVHRMDVGRIPKEALQQESGNSGAPTLRFMDACKRDLKACEIDPNNWEVAASDRASWRRTVKEGIVKADVKRHQKAEEKRARRKNSSTFPSSNFICALYSRDRPLAHWPTQRHTRRCSTTTD